MTRWVDGEHVIWNNKAASSGVYTFDYDFSAYEQVTFWFAVTGQTGDASAATFDASCFYKDPTTLTQVNDSLASWTAIANSSITQITTDSGSSGLPATAHTTLTSSHLVGRIRLSMTAGMSSGTTPTLTTTVTALLKG